MEFCCISHISIPAPIACTVPAGMKNTSPLCTGILFNISVSVLFSIAFLYSSFVTSFLQEEELAEKSARLAELNALLNIDRDRSSSQDTPEESEETEAPTTRPSVLAALGEKTNQPEPVKPFRSYYDKDGDAR